MQTDPTTIETAFGRWAKQLRGRKSQAELSELLAARGVTMDPSAISRMETGERSIRLSEAVAIADALGVELLAPAIGDRLSERQAVAERLTYLITRLNEQRSRMEFVQAERAEIAASLAVISAEIAAIQERIPPDSSWLLAVLHDRAGEPDDVFEREVLQLFEAH